MVCRHPVILASIARHLIHGSAEGARQGYRTVWTELALHTPPHAPDTWKLQVGAKGFEP